MNTKQFLSHLRTLLKFGAGALVTHGLVSQSVAESATAILIVIGALIWSHYTHTDPIEAVKDSQTDLPGMSVLLCVLGAAFAFGCSTVNTHLEVTETNGTNTVKRVTDTRGRSFFDSKNALAKWKTSNAEKTQSSGIEGLSQESTSTNLVRIVIEGAAAAVSAAK